MKRLVSLFAFLSIVSMILFSCSSAVLTGGKVTQKTLKDGVYQGEFGGFYNKAVVKVTIQNNKITHIDVLKSTGLKGGKILPVLPERIIEQQSTKVDAVTGATHSSNVLMNAVENAIRKARQ